MSEQPIQDLQEPPGEQPVASETDRPPQDEPMFPLPKLDLELRDGLVTERAEG
jgi:hypothetical protein